MALPDARGRLDVLKVHARNKPLSPDIDLEQVSRRTPGLSGASLKNLLNEAAIHAARRYAPLPLSSSLAFISIP